MEWIKLFYYTQNQKPLEKSGGFFIYRMCCNGSIPTLDVGGEVRILHSIQKCCRRLMVRTLGLSTLGCEFESRRQYDG
jgi:hypothetical protein